jgi:hypothetical protein
VGPDLAARIVVGAALINTAVGGSRRVTIVFALEA